MNRPGNWRLVPSFSMGRDQDNRGDAKIGRNRRDPTITLIGRAPSDIAAPIRRVLREQKNARVELAQVTRIDTVGKQVVLADRSLPYDYLVVATGAAHSYFAHPEWEAHAPGLKSVEDALEIRRRVLLAFEEAEREDDEQVSGEGWSVGSGGVAGAEGYQRGSDG